MAFQAERVNRPHHALLKLLLLRTKYNEISASRAISSLLCLKETFYDQGEKSGKVLAWRIKQLQSERLISIFKMTRTL